MKQYMMSGDLKSELQKVDEKFKDTVSLWQREITLYISGLEKDPLWDVIPAFVLGACRYTGVGRDLSISMANIFRTIYMVNHIHEQIKDEEEGQEYNQQMRFAILLGDYMFGKILKLLLNENAAHLVDIFAALICRLNEGLTLKYKMNADFMHNLKHIYAPFFKAAFLSASRLAGNNVDKEKAYGDLGYNLGLAICFSILNEPAHYMAKIQYHIDESIRILTEIHPENRVTPNYIHNLISEMYEGLYKTAEKAAAVV